MSRTFAMIDFYVESAIAAHRFQPASAAETKSKLERVFASLEESYGVSISDQKITGLDTAKLQRWFISASAQWKPATINAYVCAINPFLRWAYEMAVGEERYIDYDLSRLLKTVRIPDVDELPDEERPLDKYYSHEQAKELLYGDHGRNQVRDRAIMGLILYSGLRVSEVCSITVGQFRNSAHGTLRLRRKGGAWATAYIGEEAYPLIEAYLATRKDIDNPSAPLFMTTHGKPCSREQIYKALAHKQKEIGLATGPHALRHTAVSEVMNTRGAAVARDYANHKNLHVTNRYSHTTDEQRRAAANGLHW